MGLFGSRKNSDEEFARLESRLAEITPLELGTGTATARVLTSGWRKTTPVAGFELSYGERTGWLQASETLSFLRGHLSILETWGRSPSEFFLSTPASASPDSPAGAALEGVGAERIGILTPLEDGSMRLLDQWDKGQQHQLGAWLSLFSAW